MKELTLKEKFNKEVISAMKKDFGYKNNLAVPKIQKIVINSGLGRMSQQQGFQDKLLPEVMKEIGLITGQKPKWTVAKKSIAGFKSREGQVIGAKVTLRGVKMYDFMDRIIKLVMPRVRDFKGIELKNIDEHGNLSMGFKEHLVFPEITPENSKVDFGLEVTFVTSAKSKEEAEALFRHIGMPLKKSE